MLRRVFANDSAKGCDDRDCMTKYLICGCELHFQHGE
jgi:hypothetical protein